MLLLRNIFIDGLLVLASLFFYYFFAINISVDLEISFILLTVVYCRCLIVALSLGSTASLYFLFLGCFFIFILGGRYFGFSDINLAYTVAGLNLISDELISKSFTFYSLVLSLINFSYVSSFENGRTAKQLAPKLGFDKLSFDIGRICFFIFAPGTFIKFYLEFKFIGEFGYYAYYSEGVNAPFWVDVSRYLFVISFAILISANAQWQRVRIYFSLFLIFAVAFLLLGVRSSFVLYTSVLYFVYYNCYPNRPPKISTLFFVFILMISLLLFVQFYRQGWHFELSDNNLLSYFFISQSNSFYMLPFTMENLDKFTSNFSVFSPISPEAAIYRSQNLERLNELGLLGDVISYNVLGDKLFSQGKGLGGNFVAELYQSGIIVTLIMCVFIGRVIAVFQRDILYNRYFLLISLIVISNAAYMPRSSLFRNFSLLAILTIVFIVLSIFKYAIKKSNKKLK
ncbi:MAG: hypothetical protein CMK64_10815 [Pseudoalteromonas sp.]|nr:hypothetical protein [Pseudoalteromonas sp.]|tara:strand:- start:59 stop:1423 length:1365 start_codon:yes stop_codon:yes gene_type:complete